MDMIMGQECMEKSPQSIENENQQITTYLNKGQAKPPAPVFTLQLEKI